MPPVYSEKKNSFNQINSIFIILHKQRKILLFLKSNSKKQKSPSAKAKGLEISRLPLLETFGTFCWSEFIEELRNTYKLKELISLPVRAINSV